MEKQKTAHNLIEYMLSLLISNNNNIDIENFDENLPEAENTRRAYEVIKFMDEMPGGFLIYHADNNKNIIYANKALVRIFNCDNLKEFLEFTKNSFKGIVHPDELEKVELSIKEQITKSQYNLNYVEYRIICKNEEIRWIENYGHFIHTETAGDIFYVFLGDATEKYKRHIEEKANEEKLTNILQSQINQFKKEKKLITQEHLHRLEVIEGLSINYESILYADLDADKILSYRLSSRTVYQFEEIFQLRGFKGYIADYIDMWVHPEDKKMLSKFTDINYIRKKLSCEKTYYINYRVINAGETQYLQLRIVNVGNKKHVSQIVLGYSRVDEEIRREMEQKQILEEALNNANLAIIAKNTFLSNMSHDIRTPLNAIFGFSALAKKHILDKTAVENYLNKIEYSSKKLLELIEKVLEISWTESKNIHVKEAECNLRDIMDEIHKTLLPVIDKKELNFTMDLDDLIHYDVYGDCDKLKKIILYISENAVTYTNIGGKVNITVQEIEKFSNNSATYKFIIEDTGIGISKDFLEHIFEPFEREKNTTLSGIHGSGLGLTIVKNFVEMMNGNIKVRSVSGKGSTFIVTICLRIQRKPSSLSSDINDTPNNFSNKRILLVEDNEINLELETEILSEFGFIIETATNGQIAVEKVKNSKPGYYALVLTDVQMPVMDGQQAAREIRKLDNPKLSNIPIIALSANAFESDKQTSIKSGINEHLTKPVDIPLLISTISKNIKSYNT
ncbi:MAG: response regulator [Clostridiales bacterium]|nr:response regulator [Clostridiales bacterium]